VVGSFSGGANSNTWGLTAKSLNIATGAGVPAGSYVSVWIEYYPLDGAASTVSASSQDTTNIVASKLQVGGGSPLTRYARYSPSLSPALVAANTTAEQSFAGILTSGDIVIGISKPSTQAGLGIVGWRASGTTLFITFSNNTASPITPTAAETYQVVAVQ
jgi:hypothetical protein